MTDDRRSTTLFVLTLLVALASTWVIYRVEARATCQSVYNNAFAGQLTARSLIADDASRATLRADAAVDTLLSGFAELAATVPLDESAAQKRVTDEKSRKLFTRYTRLRRAAKDAQLAVVAARAAHPLPPIPHC